MEESNGNEENGQRDGFIEEMKRHFGRGDIVP
jgi:hypothetical protein